MDKLISTYLGRDDLKNVKELAKYIAIEIYENANEIKCSTIEHLIGDVCESYFSAGIGIGRVLPNAAIRTASDAATYVSEYKCRACQEPCLDIILNGVKLSKIHYCSKCDKYLTYHKTQKVEQDGAAKI